MITSLSTVPDGAVLDYDLAIVGAGAAGITLALELERSGRRIALLEGGGVDATPESQARYEGPLTVGDGTFYPPLDAWRLRHLGGTTNHWAGWCRPLEPNAFEARPGRTEHAWPFGRAELDPDYERAHEICRLGRLEYDASTLLRDAGLTERVVATDVLATPVFRYSPPVRFADAYRAMLDGDEVDTYVEANCVGFELAGDRVVAVRLRGEAGNECTMRAPVVVLACGGIENVRQLLLLARQGAAVDRSGTLGLGFMEHPHVGRGGWLLVDESWPDADTRALLRRVDDVDGTPFKVAFGLQPEILREHRMMNVSFTVSDETESALATMPHGDALGALHRAWRADGPRLVRLFARTEMRSSADSHIVLAGETDDLGLPRAGLHLRVSDLDRRDIDLGRRLVMAELMAQGFGPAAVPHRDDEIVSGGGHHLGGARMHVDPDHGVVDADLRCHALTNLYVAGGATFPTSCFSNPTLTIVALAVRLARHLERVG